jgi:hypothetical protein
MRFYTAYELWEKWNTQFTHKDKKLIQNKENKKKMFSLYFTENKGYIYTSEKYGKVKKHVFLSLLSCGSWVRIPTGSHLF